MPVFEFVQCDVFAERAFEGNPLAVFLDARGIDDATMQKLAREMNLSETVFVLPPTDERTAKRKLRIFTPARELPLAGHPVVGTWSVLARRGVVAPPASGAGSVTIHQELRAGVLPVTVEFAGGLPSRVAMTQPAAEIGPPLPLKAQAARALGLADTDIDERQTPILVASTGVPFLNVPLRTRDALRRIRVDGASLSELLRISRSNGVYAYTSDVGHTRAKVSTRMLADAALGISEDSATGIAAGPLAATLVHHGVVQPTDGVARFVIEQGVDMGRPSAIHAEIEGGAGEVRAIRIAGATVEVLRGEVGW